MTIGPDPITRTWWMSSRFGKASADLHREQDAPGDRDETDQRDRPDPRGCRRRTDDDAVVGVGAVPAVTAVLLVLGVLHGVDRLGVRTVVAHASPPRVVSCRPRCAASCHTSRASA